ncbi:MAG: hypothetical protein M1818_001191 [Claussenomyces sp. TS43310]|nr:MAG: hypothetical protein M1818_001191 [Claussenomyces sp. TS43310]
MAASTQPLQARHPLQRLESPGRRVSAAIHLVGLCSFAGSYAYLVYGPQTYLSESYGWYWQLLTIIGLSLATLTFAIGFLADLTLNPQLFFLKNSLSLCSAPLELLIAILYWGLTALNPGLVKPPSVTIDLRDDIGFHAMPAILLTLDLLLLSPPWTIAVMPAMGLSAILAFSYWGWVEHCHAQNGWYPYPLFALLSTGQRVLLFAFAALTMTASTALLKWLYGRVNGLQGEQRTATPAAVQGKKER